MDKSLLTSTIPNPHPRRFLQTAPLQERAADAIDPRLSLLEKPRDGGRAALQDGAVPL